MATPAVHLRVRGGCNVPGSWSPRINWTYPFAVLTVEPAQVTITTPGVVHWTNERRTDPSEVVETFPVLGTFRTRGVGIRLQRWDEEEWYFWTREEGRILGALQAAGFPVSAVRQPVVSWSSRQGFD